MHLMALRAFRHPTPRQLSSLRAFCLNAPYGAPCFLTGRLRTTLSSGSGLNAPYGAPCFLTRMVLERFDSPFWCLNAPYGAPCFLTINSDFDDPEERKRLNAPYGAPCFLTSGRVRGLRWRWSLVLMHLMVLRAF